MLGSSDGLLSQDSMDKLFWAIIGGVITFLFGLWLEKTKARREPKLRLSYDLAVSGSMATVPTELAERVLVAFDGNRVSGQLYEVTCLVTNTGNRVIKKQFLRFSFPEGARVLDTYLGSEAPPEYGVAETPMEDQKPGDRRWFIGHLERGQAVEFGMLVEASTPVHPELHPHNDEGGVTVDPRAVSAVKDDAEHIAPLFLLGFLAFFLPPLASTLLGILGGFVTNAVGLIVQGVLFFLILPHVAPVGRLIARRAVAKRQTEEQTIVVNGNHGRFFLATRGGVLRTTERDEWGEDEENP